MAKELWILAEQQDGKLRKSVSPLFSEGGRIARLLAMRLCAVVIGYETEELVAGLATLGPDRIYVAEDEKLKEYTTDGYAWVLSNLLREYNPQVVILGHTALGKDLAPRVAQRLGLGLASDCTGLYLDGDKLIFRRPLYAGKALAHISFLRTPVLATIRPNVFRSEEIQAGQPEVIRVQTEIGNGLIRTVTKEISRKISGRVALSEADIVVAGGRGLKNPENFTVLEELAATLGGAVGASRAVVDAGWRDYGDQIGQTGKTVSPTLYFACGISGAIQHLAGMSTSKIIVAVNKDPEANIFKVADYGIVGDVMEIVPVLNEEFKKIMQSE